MVTDAPPDLSVVVPAYNEARRLGTNLRVLLAYLQGLPHAFELLVVDDGSSDRTAEVAREALAGHAASSVLRYTPNRGKGYAIRTGVLASRGRWVVFTDADLSTPVEEIARAVRRLERSDIVIGSRALQQSRIALRPPLYRRLATAVFDLVKHAVVGLWNIQDTQCGFKAYRGEVARALYRRARVDRFMFDVEILYLAERAGYGIDEMPVTWAASDESKVRFVEGLVNMVRDLVRIRWHHGRATPDALKGERRIVESPNR